MKERAALLLTLVLVLVALASALFLLHSDRHSFLYYGDAASHIVKARALFDAQHPGPGNLGTVWLPLPHILLSPAAAVDVLFVSGLAGAAVGIPCYAGTCVLLFLIVRRLTGSTPIAFLSALLFGLNPNVVYMSLIPMNEPSLFLFVTLGGYALLRWLQDRSTWWLMASAVSIMLATLCRYEAWLLPPYLILLTLWYGRDQGKKFPGVGARTTAWVAVISVSGILLWCGWNLFRYGDALTFARWTFDAAAPAVHSSPERLPLRIFENVARALFVIFGPVVLIGAAGICSRTHTGPEQKGRLPVLVYFLLPALFILASLFANFVQIDQWRWNWRYVLTAGLFLAVAGGSGLRTIFDRVRPAWGRGVITAALLVMPIVQLTVPAVGVATFDDAARVYSDDPRAGTAVGEQLGARYHGGGIALIMGYGQAQRIMVSSGLDLTNFDFLHNPAEDAPLGAITDREQFLIIGKDRSPESAHYVDSLLANRGALLLDHRLQSEDPHYLVLDRRPDARPIP